MAAVAASVPTPDNFKCTPAPVGTPGTSVMIMNGTDDPLVPFAGGEVNLLGLFYKGGNVRSSPHLPICQPNTSPTTTSSPARR